MKRIILICISLLLVLTSGCGMNDNNKNTTNDSKTEAIKPKDMDPKDLPQVPAFQDEKTREYMVSTKEEEPGYYVLESKLKGFRMLFPADGEYSSYLSSRDENEEIIAFDSYEKTKNKMLNAQIEYYQRTSFINNPETMLEQVRSENGYNGSFEKLENEDIDIYIAHKKNHFQNDKNKYSFSYRYFGYIKSPEKKQAGIVFSFMFRCPNDEKPCTLDQDHLGDQVKKQMKSITFLDHKQEK
ncbi:lipoprotein YvcA [Bacillus vallismortis]|uniref:lipoprotein YvcA n=1 Tax=Bacillus vallismortis TaxID=72361 RepID=UPI00227FBCA5|nr:lipoprotein YvcA [Bacillus vallismortis]MCY8533719.1 lipoprotein YvcA [Bacillus vallismortis]MCY8544330.1 lipoprotein YvcA [Bacillus vallismortis]